MTRTAKCTTSQGKPLTFEGVRASGEVHGRMLEMRLEQRFRNPEDQNVEVNYTFPLPWGAVLMGIDVTLNDQKLHGVVTAKQQAREQYEEALSEGNTSILVSRNRDQSYTLELGNLLAGELCTIVLRYAQLLQPEQGSLRLMLPTTIAPRYGDDVRDGHFEPHAAPVISTVAEYPFDIQLKFHGALAQARVSSPSHALASQHVDGAVSVRLALHSWLDRDFVVVLNDLAQTSMGISAVDQVEPGITTVLASFSPVLPASPAVPLALKVLVDCSGSMNGDSIEAARRALVKIVEGLTPQDRFSLSRFGSSVEHRSKALWAGARPAKAAAMQWVENLKADLGGTEMTRALKSTMALPHSQSCDLLLVTDGEIHGIDEVLAAATSARHRIFVVGIGASPAETHLRRLASATGGACEFVAPGEAVEPAVLRMFHRLRSPSVTGIRIDWPFKSNLIEASSVPSSIFDGDTVTVFGRLQVESVRLLEAPIRLLGKYNGRQEEAVLAELTFGPIEDQANTMARLWANSRCEALADLGDSVEEEAVGVLAERYQLVTEHTHFLLVLERASKEKPEEMPELRQVGSMMAAGWGGVGKVHSQHKEVGTGDVLFSLAAPSYENLSTPSVWRTNRTQAAAPRSALGRDGYEIPAFLQKIEDVSTSEERLPFEIRANPEWWAKSSASDTRHLAQSAGNATPEGWNHGYQGLTPAGLREFLRITKKTHWPKSYGWMVALGLGREVADWLEFVVGRGSSEAVVVKTFLDLVLQITFAEAQDPLAAEPLTHADSSIRETTSESDDLAHALAQALARTHPRRWPEEVVHFAEATFTV